MRDKKDNQDLNDYPDDVKEDYLQLCDWIKDWSRTYGEKILIRLTDAQSLQGVYKSFRHRVFRYPAFIINHQKKYVGKDKAHLDDLLREELADA